MVSSRVERATLGLVGSEARPSASWRSFPSLALALSFHLKNHPWITCSLLSEEGSLPNPAQPTPVDMQDTYESEHLTFWEWMWEVKELCIECHRHLKLTNKEDHPQKNISFLGWWWWWWPRCVSRGLNWKRTDKWPKESVSFFNKDFLPCCAIWGILVPQPETEPTLPVVEVRSLNHWAAREVSGKCLFPLEASSGISILEFNYTHPVPCFLCQPDEHHDSNKISNNLRSQTCYFL